jgi:hypothetical protein
LDLDCLDAGIPDDAFKAVTGDDKKLATDFKKRNKKERENQGQLSIFETAADDNYIFAKLWQELADFSENTPQEVKEKERKYQDNLLDNHWWLKYVACNLWTSAFFRPLTEHNLQLLPTTETLNRLKRELVQKVLNSDSNYELRVTNYELQGLIEAANNLAKEKYFFHWPLEFPEVFEDGGFSCVLGNPPWEQLQLDPREFFAVRDSKIAEAQNMTARDKMIAKLKTENHSLYAEFELAKHDIDAYQKFIHSANRFPLTSFGRINLYSLFAEFAKNVLSSNGRTGIIVPTGIATDSFNQYFFGDLIQKQNLASLYDFENREGLFTSVHRSYKFSLLALSGKPIKRSNFAFFLTQPKQLENQTRLFQLSPQDIALINPNTLTCPVFRTSKDAELTKKIYQNIPVLQNEKTGINPWGISFMLMFMMNTDSGLFHTQDPGLLKEVRDLNTQKVPLYEAKMLHQFDHRWATYTDNGDTRDLTDDEKSDLSFTVKPRYWVDKKEVENKLSGKWDKNWLLGFRDITNSTNERTAIFSLLPKIAVGNSAAVIILAIDKANLVSCLIANFSSLVFDFVTRHKVGGTHMNFFIVKQLPVIPPEKYTQKDIEYITPRVLELVYTSWDMQPFAQDMGYNGEPFIWNPNKRALIRAELDAYYAKLYQLTRDELRYILDPADVYGADFPSETFRVLKNNEIKQFGEYRTQRLVLEAWDVIRNS